MSWDQIEGNWKQAMAEVKQKWAKLTDDDVVLIRGKRDELIGKPGALRNRKRSGRKAG